METLKEPTPKLAFKKLAAFDEQDANLINIRNSLYNRSWSKMCRDLRRTLKTKGYIIRLANKIRNDLDRIESLKDLSEDDLTDIATTLSYEIA